MILVNRDRKVILQDKPLPPDRYKDVKINNETDSFRGGFVNTVFLGSLIMTATLWILIIFIIGSR